MDDARDSTVARATATPHRFLTRGVKAAIAVVVVVVLAAGAGGAYAYSSQAAEQNAAAEHAAAAQLASMRTKLLLATNSARELETALTAVGTAATGVADAQTLASLTAAIAILKDETDKPAFPMTAPIAALVDRKLDLDQAVAAASAAVQPVGVSVQTVSTTRLASAGSASPASASAAKSALAALKLAIARGDDPRGLIMSAITAVKVAQASSAAAVAAAAAAQAHAATSAHHSSGGSAHVSAGGRAPVCTSDVLTCVNQIRAYYGLRALHANGSLNATAQACAARMASADSMTHSPYPGGWSHWGENIAMGFGSSVSVFNAWMASPGHRANILKAAYTQMGIGHVAAGGWWCQQFGG
jgi:uncharacterized protein YkwD